jgi:hypothetical protein
MLVACGNLIGLLSGAHKNASGLGLLDFQINLP